MAAALTKAELEEFHADEQERKRLGRAAADLEAKHKALKARILEYVRERGGVDRTTVCHGFVLSITHRPGTVAWKDAYIGKAGVDAAEELRTAAKPIELLNVEKKGAA